MAGSLIQVKVKTLDAQTHEFSVDPQITVRDFKSHIQSSVSVESDQQRLIYCGKVLADDKDLANYDLDGKTVHLVIRPPPAATNSPSDGTSDQASDPSGRRSAPPGNAAAGGAFENGQLYGAFYVPRTGNFQQIVQDVISNLGDLGRNATVMSSTSADGASVDVHINLGQISGQSHTNFQVQSRVHQIRQLLESVDRDLWDLEHTDTQRPESNETSTSSPPPPLPMDTSSPSSPAASTRSGPVDAAEAAMAAAAAAETAAQLARQAAAAAVSASVFSTSAAAAARPPAGPQVRITARQVLLAGSGSGGATTDPVATAESQAAAGGQQPPSARRSGGQGPTSTAAVSDIDFANIIQSVRQCEDRVRSHVMRLEERLRDTTAPNNSRMEEENVRLHRNVSSIMHQFGHVYYLLSDLYVCFHQPSPRRVGLFTVSPDIEPLPMTAAAAAVPPPAPSGRAPRSASVPRTRSAGLSAAGAPPSGIRVAGTPVIVVDYGPALRIQTSAAAPQPPVIRTGTSADAAPPAAPPVTSTSIAATAGPTPAPVSASVQMPVGITVPSTAAATRAVPIAIPVTVPVIRTASVPVSASIVAAAAATRGSDDTTGGWEREVPAAWLPVIRADLMQQRSHPPVRESVFSEAYLNGIPNRKKRRTDGHDDENSGSGGGGSRA